MTDNIALNKAATIERCLKRINDEYKGREQFFLTDFNKQDVIVLNLLRAIEAAIGMCAYWIRKHHLGLPQSSQEMFSLLEEAKIIDHNLSEKLQNMISFRNIALHDYTRLNLAIVKNIIEKELQNIVELRRIILKDTNK